MSETSEGTSIPLRHRGRRRVLLAAVSTFVVLAGGLLYGWLVRPERVRLIAESYLQQYTSGRVEIGSADLAWLRDLHLYDVAIHSQSPNAHANPADGWSGSGLQLSDPDSAPDFACSLPELWIGLNRGALLGGGWRIRSVTAVEPQCAITHGRTGLADLGGLVRFPALAELNKGGAFPIIEIQDARLRLSHREGDDDRLVDELALTIRARPSPNRGDVYDIVWQVPGEGLTSEPDAVAGHLQFDLRTGQLRNIRGGLPPVSMEAIVLALSTPDNDAAAWRDRLGLTGIVRAEDFTLFGPASAEQESQATIRFGDVTVSIPIQEDERTLAPTERYLRFERLNGHANLVREKLDVELGGVFHGNPCRVEVGIPEPFERLGAPGEAGFDLRLVVEGLTLPQALGQQHPAQSRVVNRWSSLAKFYRDYDPHGVADVEIEVSKPAGAGQRMGVRRALLMARGGDFSSRFFPYRVRNVRGSVDFTPNGVQVRNLQGEHDGGLVSIDGWFARPSRMAAKRLTIEGRGVPIDEELCAALREKCGGICEQFDPRGTVDVQMELAQAEGTAEGPAPWRRRGTIALRGVSAAHQSFPLSFENLTGRIDVNTDAIDLHLAGRSRRAPVRIEGLVLLQGGRAQPVGVTVSGTDLGFDSSVIALLPEKVRALAEPYNPRGRADYVTSLRLHPDSDRIVHETQITLTDAALGIGDPPQDLTGVHGCLQLSPTCVQFSNLRGRLGGGEVSLEGSVDWADGDESTELTVRTRHSRLDEGLLGLIPQGLRGAVGQWSIEGPISSETVVRSKGRSASAAKTTWTLARLDGVQLRHPRFPAVLEEVRGDLMIDASGLRAEGISARFGRARIRLDLVSGTGNGDPDLRETTLTISANGLALDASIGDLLPAAFAQAWRCFRPEGLIDVQVEAKRVQGRGAEAECGWTLAGYVEFNDVGLQELGGLQRLFGTWTGSGCLAGSDGKTELSGKLALSSVELFRHRLTQGESDWSYTRPAGGKGVLALHEIRGRIQDGSVTGQMELTLGGVQTQYRLAATVWGVKFSPTAKKGGVARAVQPEPTEGPSLLNGHIQLAGATDQPATRRGGGRFEILEGPIYRVPLILAILNVLNLTLPDQSFDQAKVDFYVIGDRVRFEDILLRGKAASLIGSGSMSWPDRGLDVHLVHATPHRWARVPIVSEVIEGASREFVQLHVSGPLDQPTVRAQPLRGINEELKRLFQKRKPGRSQADVHVPWGSSPQAVAQEDTHAPHPTFNGR